MRPEISILMAYWRRPQQLRVTLESYRHWYAGRFDRFELIVIADTPTTDELIELTGLLTEARDVGLDASVEVVDRSAQRFRNPGTLFNRAAEMASAPVLALTNPECAHMGAVFDHALAHRAPNRYLVYGCVNTSRVPACFADLTQGNGLLADWYQHSVQSNRLLHFMTAIEKADFDRLGGFDPVFDRGIAYEDSDFAQCVRAAGLEVQVVDEPFVAHLTHDRGHHDPAGVLINRAIYESRWGGP